MANVGVLTGGGDCPGLNPAIRGIMRQAQKTGDTIVGIRRGWKGLLTKTTCPINADTVDELLYIGGTVLGTSRTNPYKEENGPAKAKENFKAMGLDALIAIGGEDTLGVASKLHAEGMHVVGLPKTIDNDLEITDFTLGFPTAVEIATEALDRVKTTAQSHDRVIVVEVMGRHAGWLTLYSGIAGGADVILLPEFPMPLKEVCDILAKCQKRGKNYAIVAVAEGAKILDDSGKEITIHSAEAVDSFGHVQLGGIGELVTKVIKEKTKRDTRCTVLGHTQRGGSPSAFDRVLSTAFGVHAMKLVQKKEWGKMPALSKGKLITVPLAEAVAKLKLVNEEFYDYDLVFLG